MVNYSGDSFLEMLFLQFGKQENFMWESLLQIVSETFTRGSRPELFCKKGVLRNFGKLTGKHLCQRLFLNKNTGLWPATLLLKRLWGRYFPVNFPKFLRTPFYIENLWWLLLSQIIYRFSFF